MTIPDAISTDRAKAYLGIPSAVTRHDTFLGYLISAATEEVSTRLGLSSGLSVSTYSETLDVEDEGEDQVRVSAYPIVSVVALTDSGSLVPSASYYVHRSRRWVRLVDDLGSFTRGRQTVEITYTAGWTSPPAPLLHAVTANVAHWFNRVPKSGMVSERIGAYSIALAQGEAALCQEAEIILAQHASPIVQR